MIMKIAFLIPTVSGGGAERFTANITNRLSRHPGDIIYLITGKKLEGEYETAENIHRLCLLSGNLIKDLASVRKYLKHTGIDICVGIDIYPNIILSMINFNLKTKTVLSERTAPGCVPYSGVTKLFRHVFYPNADYFVFQTQEAKEFYPQAIQRKASVIPNPVKENLPLRTEPVKKEIVAVGRLVKLKNYSMLLRAFKNIHAEFPEYILRIFGEGDQKKNLKNITMEYGIEQAVVFEGFCENVHEKIKHSEIFVMTSDLEGMPNALLEAMAMGFPVISTDCPAGAPREMIGENQNGILVPVNNPTELTKAIRVLIEDCKLRNRLSANAMKKSEDYSMSRIEKMWEELFLKLV